MNKATQVCAARGQVVVSQDDAPVEPFLTDMYIAQGKVGTLDLSHGCYTWCELLQLAAAELWRCGEVESTRVTLKADQMTVRQFPRERFGVVTGRREYWHRDNWTPDRADLHEFLGALRK